MWRELVESSREKPITDEVVEQVVTKKELVKSGNAITNISLRTVCGGRFRTCR